MRKRLQLAAGGAAVLLLGFFFAVVFLPADAVVGVASRGLAREGYTLTVSRAAKVFPLGLRLRNAEISDSRGPLLRFDDVTARLRLLPLLTGSVSGGFEARIGAGRIEGTIAGGKEKTRFTVERVPLDGIPFFATVTGAAVRGLLSGSGEMWGADRSLTGSIRAEVTSAVIDEVKIGGVPLPGATYERIQGMLRIDGGKAKLESLNLEGEGLYARLSGDFPLASPQGTSPLSLNLELMPKPEFLEKQKLVFLLLAKYLDSPGHYRIPIGGTLGTPALR
jgi:type II secretion system protein N